MKLLTAWTATQAVTISTSGLTVAGIGGFQ